MSTEAYPPTARTTPTRSRDRVDYDRAAVHAVLDEATVCHVGFVVEGRPVVLPQLHVRVDDDLYLHGSTAARALRTAADDGLEVCVTVTLVDGLVLARSAFHHSVNYRSVVALGRAELVRDEREKALVLDALVEAVVPGRSAGTRAPNRRELAATAVLRLPLREVSVKARSGPPSDDPEDLDLPHWAGVLPLSTRRGTPEPAPGLTQLPVPEHLRAWVDAEPEAVGSDHG
jgi:nitroimidazol reductase NimA-like FMN-containing flavoprotein (pyridoxamine 5'-phosphate oxidase superfamily)